MQGEHVRRINCTWQTRRARTGNAKSRLTLKSWRFYEMKTDMCECEAKMWFKGDLWVWISQWLKDLKGKCFTKQLHFNFNLSVSISKQDCRSKLEDLQVFCTEGIVFCLQTCTLAHWNCNFVEFNFSFSDCFSPAVSFLGRGWVSSLDVTSTVCVRGWITLVFWISLTITHSLALVQSLFSPCLALV